jgi:hypothetical protein
MAVIFERLNGAYSNLERAINTLYECAECDYVPDPDKIREIACKLLTAASDFERMKSYVDIKEHLWEHHGIDVGSLKNKSDEELETLHSELHGRA